MFTILIILIPVLFGGLVFFLVYRGLKAFERKLNRHHPIIATRNGRRLGKFRTAEEAFRVFSFYPGGVYKLRVAGEGRPFLKITGQIQRT